MGGHITVDSELNKGTMFSFSIWVETPEEETAEVRLPVDNNYAKNIHEALGADDEIEKAYIYGSEEKTERNLMNICRNLFSALKWKTGRKQRIFLIP